MKLKKQFSIGLSFVLAIALTACSTPKLYHEAEGNVDSVEQRIAQTQQAGKFPVLERATRFARADTSFNTQQPLPAWGQSQINLNARNLPLQFIVDKVLSRTGAIADYQSDVNQAMPINLNYNGTVKGALDRIAAATNYAYTVENNTVTWSGFITKTFDISFMPGVSQYQMGKASGAQKTLQSGDGNAFGFTDVGSQYSNLQGSLSVWNDLSQTLDELKSKEGKVFVSQATTSVTMTDRPQNVRIMTTYLKHLNQELSRQVALDVQVLQVNLSDAYEYGINWNLVRAFASHNTQFGISAGLAQSVNLQPLNGQGDSGFIMKGLPQLDGSFLNSVLIKALSQQGKVSVITQPRTVTLNNQVAELSINSQQSYLRQVSVTQGTNLTGGTTTAVTPGVVSTGFNLYILPKIQGNKVYLQISSTLANLVQIRERTFGNATTSDSQFSIQLPEVDEKRFNQKTLVPSSATLVVAGFKQLRNTANKQQLFGQQALGGHGAQKENSEIILLITPTIMENNN
ncbi:MAG: bfpB [Gammaproteobacteria bacterium]|jgi:type IVB pilus formation R64 PilN family outer membrane protein|nr:bfpB [Gammaproteobacteria bacterium]